MGRSIVYCGDCGTFLREQDFERGAAREIDRRPFCARCRPPAPAGLPKVASRASTGRVPKIGTTRRPVRRSRSRGPVVAAVAVLIAVAIGVAVLSSAPGRPEPKAAPAEAKATAAPSRVTLGGPTGETGVSLGSR